MFEKFRQKNTPPREIGRVKTEKQRIRYMKQDEDTQEKEQRQAKKEEFLNLILDQFEDCAYVMIGAIRSFRKCFNMPREKDK